MRRLLRVPIAAVPLLMAAQVAALIALGGTSTAPSVAGVPTAILVASHGPDQNLPPGAIKHPGERCYSTIQPPENQGCPLRSDQDCVDAGPRSGGPYFIGECVAARRGFFNPPDNFQPRNRTETCITNTENHNGYDRSANRDHMGRWQDTRSLFHDHGGQDDWDMPPSPAEQDYVAVNIISSVGYQPWVGFDGC